jgi:hypothetical protein
MAPADQKNLVVAYFPERIGVQQSIAELRALGIPDERLHLAMPRGQRARVIAGLPDVTEGAEQQEEGISGILARLGLAPGGLQKALADLGLSGGDARYFAEQLEEGNIVLAVACGALCESARQLLKLYGGFGLRSSGQ